MKHFIIEIIYNVPFERISFLVEKHRTFLQNGYNEGIFLYSGPMVPKEGGIVAARAESLEILKKFMDNDPYKLEELAEHRYIEFEPVKYNNILKEWI